MYEIAETTGKLGEIVTKRRENEGLSRRKAAPQAGVGNRFLGEFEKGKPTAELGKVMAVLHSRGLDLAVVERRLKPDAITTFLSKRVGTEFPYDWSNSRMTEQVFIHKVLEASRFNDVLHTVSYFGFDRVSQELPCLKEPQARTKMIDMLMRIQKGMLLAQCVANTANEDEYQDAT